MPKWKEFEDLAYQIQSELAADSQVKKNDSLRGHDSKIDRQIDISINRSAGQFTLLVVIECKDYKVPVDIAEVGAFVTTVRDVRANKGAIVSSKGFTEAAISLAKQHGIDTFRLIDTNNQNWKAYVSIPMLLQRSHRKGFKLRFEKFKSLPRSVMEMDLRLLQLFSPNHEPMGTVSDILAKKWNDREISHEPGEYEALLVQDGFIHTGSDVISITVKATILVGRSFYFGHVPVKTRGFKDEQSGGLYTRQITTDSIEPAKIESGLVKGWRQIEDPTTLAVKPCMLMRYTDVWPVGGDQLENA